MFHTSTSDVFWQHLRSLIWSGACVSHEDLQNFDALTLRSCFQHLGKQRAAKVAHQQHTAMLCAILPLEAKSIARTAACCTEFGHYWFLVC